MGIVSEREVAKRLGISLEDIKKLVGQEILHPEKKENGSYVFSSDEIDRLSSNNNPSLSDEAAEMGIQIQREVVTSISGLQKLMKRLSVTAVGLFSLLAILTGALACFFMLFPAKTSDFFGYYYRFNKPGEQKTALADTSQHKVLGATTGAQATAPKTSVLADALKPIAATSLLVVKVINNQQYQEIVTNPSASSSLPGPAGSQGPAGQNGGDGKDGSNGANGTNGTNGLNGANGIAAIDVTSQPGDIIIRNGLNSIARLGAGSNGQVLKITGGIPGWADSGLNVEIDTFATVTARGSSTNDLVIFNNGLSVSSGPISLPSNSVSIATLVSGDYSSKITNGTYGIDITGNAATSTTAASFSGVLLGDVTGTQGLTNVAKINGGPLGNTTPTAGNLLIGSGTSWTTQTLSGDIAIDGNGVVSLTSIGTPGTYGSTLSIPVLTTDAQGRVSGVSNTTIAGLTNANLSGTAGITNANLANSALTFNSGAGLTGGGIISLGETANLDIGAGNGIAVNANDIAINLVASGTSGASSSRSGLELSSSGLSLLLGCNDNDILKWTDAGGWACAADETGGSSGTNLLHDAAYDNSQDMTNVTSSQTTLGSVTVAPTTATSDVYVTGHADVFSSSNADQPFTLTVETTNNCTGIPVGNATVTYTVSSSPSNNYNRGSLTIYGVTLNPGASAHDYSLCASTSAGDTDVMNWSIDALVIDTGGN